MVPDPCQHCQYDLTGVPVVSKNRVCPECGETTPLGYIPRTGAAPVIWFVAIFCGVALCVGIVPLSVHLGDRGYSVLLPLGLAILGSSLSAGIAGTLKHRADRSPLGAWRVAIGVGVPTAIVSGLAAMFFHFLGTTANC